MKQHCQRLKDDIIKMASYAEALLRLVTDSKCPPIESFKTEAFGYENKINEFHKLIDTQCFQILSDLNPKDKDLRLIITAVKINADLERIGDQSINVLPLVRIYREPELAELIGLLDNMNNEVVKMLKYTIDSLVFSDTDLAMEVIVSDRKVNALNRYAFQEVIKNQSLPRDKQLDFIFFCKNLERIGDHCTNIAEDVIYIETGKDIRHPDAHKIKKATYEIS